jgi:hypothetical protein
MTGILQQRRPKTVLTLINASPNVSQNDRVSRQSITVLKEDSKKSCVPGMLGTISVNYEAKAYLSKTKTKYCKSRCSQQPNSHSEAAEFTILTVPWNDQRLH